MGTVQDTPSRLKILFPSKTTAFREDDDIKVPVELAYVSKRHTLSFSFDKFPPPCVYSPFVSASSHLSWKLER